MSICRSGSHRTVLNRLLSILWAIGLSLSFGCGGLPDAPPSIQIKKALSQEEVELSISFYEFDVRCATLRQLNPRPTPLLGPYIAPIRSDQRGSTAPLKFEPEPFLPIGMYVVWAETYDRGGNVVSTGCSPGQKVNEAALSPIRVELD